MTERYVRFNEQTFDFVPVMLEKATAEMNQMYPKGWDIWEQYRQIDGVTEYVAADIIAAQVYQTLNMRGISYEMYTDETPYAPKVFSRLEWNQREGWTRGLEVPAFQSLDFRKHLPHPLYGFETVNTLIDVSHCLELLKRNHEDTLFAMWIADVKGAIAYGNQPGEAVIHAWGIWKGIWQPDTYLDRSGGKPA